MPADRIGRWIRSNGSESEPIRSGKANQISPAHCSRAQAQQVLTAHEPISSHRCERLALSSSLKRKRVVGFASANVIRPTRPYCARQVQRCKSHPSSGRLLVSCGDRICSARLDSTRSGKRKLFLSLRRRAHFRMDFKPEIVWICAKFVFSHLRGPNPFGSDRIGSDPSEQPLRST